MTTVVLVAVEVAAFCGEVATVVVVLPPLLLEVMDVFVVDLAVLVAVPDPPAVPLEVVPVEEDVVVAPPVLPLPLPLVVDDEEVVPVLLAVPLPEGVVPLAVVEAAAAAASATCLACLAAALVLSAMERLRFRSTAQPFSWIPCSTNRRPLFVMAFTLPIMAMAITRTSIFMVQRKDWRLFVFTLTSDGDTQDDDKGTVKGRGGKPKTRREQVVGDRRHTSILTMSLQLVARLQKNLLSRTCSYH